MKGKDLLDVMEYIDPELVEEADREPLRGRFPWPVWIAGVACLAVLFLGLWVWSHRDPGYVVNPTETTVPEATELYWNEASVTRVLVDPSPSYWERFSVEINEVWVREMLPKDLPDWAAFAGSVTYGGDKEIHSYLLTQEETPWSSPLYLEIQTSPFDLESRESAIQAGADTMTKLFNSQQFPGGGFRAVPVDPVVTNVKGLLCAAYLCKPQDSNDSNELYVEFRIGELYYLIRTVAEGTTHMSPETARQTAETGLWELMTGFAAMHRKETPVEEGAFLYNACYPVSFLQMEPHTSFYCRFSETCMAGELAELVPEHLPDWGDFESKVTYDRTLAPSEVVLTLEESPWSRPITIRIQSQSYDGQNRDAAQERGEKTIQKEFGPYRFFHAPLYPGVTDVDGLICTAYEDAEPDEYGATRLFFEFRVGQLFYLVETTVMGTAHMSPETARDTAEACLWELLSCFAALEEQEPTSTLSHFHPKQASDYAMDQLLTLAQTREKEPLGTWMPLTAPFSGAEEAPREEIRYHSHPHENWVQHNYMEGIWAGADLNLVWKVSYVDVTSGNAPDCLLEDLTQELVGQELRSGSSLTVECQGVWVEISLDSSGEALSPWVYDQLMLLKDRNSGALQWNQPEPLVIYADDPVPYQNALPVELTPERLGQCVPEVAAEWMDFSGVSLWLGQEHLHSVCLTLPTSNGKDGITVFLQEAPESLTWSDETLTQAMALTRFPVDGIYEPYATESPVLIRINNQPVAVYRHTDQRAHTTRLLAQFYRGGLQYGVFLEVAPEEQEQASRDLWELLVCYAHSPAVPDLSTFPRGQENVVNPIDGQP